jgi:hypothetical protein
LSLALRILLKISRQIGFSEFLNYSFLDQIDELNSLESVIDLLKFVNSDSNADLVKCSKI